MRYLAQNGEVAVKIDKYSGELTVVIRSNQDSLQKARKEAIKQLLLVGLDKKKFRFKAGDLGIQTAHCFNSEYMEPCWELACTYKDVIQELELREIW